MNLEAIWPKEEDLVNIPTDVDLAPYGVLSQYSEAIFDTYNKKLIGVILSRSSVKSNGDKTKFTYSLVVSQTRNESVQIKIIEIDIADDGWYPVTVYLTKPNREIIGIAETEKQLRTFLENGIQSEFVKKQINSLLKN